MAHKAEEKVSPRELTDPLEAKIKEQWPEAMAAYRDHVQNMKRAVDDARLAEFQHEVRDIRSAMKACHRAFK